MSPNGSFVFCSVLVDLLHLHPAVLEPDLHLPFGEVEQPGHLVPAVPREIHVEQKLFLQFQRLMLCIRAPLLPCGASMKPVGGRVICGGDRHWFRRSILEGYEGASWGGGGPLAEVQDAAELVRESKMSPGRGTHEESLTPAPLPSPPRSLPSPVLLPPTVCLL